MKLVDHRAALFWAFATISVTIAHGSDAHNTNQPCTRSGTSVTALTEPVVVSHQTVPTGAPVRQISDGQVQVPVSLSAASSVEGQSPGPSSVPAEQLRNPKGAHNNKTSELPPSVSSSISKPSQIRSDTTVETQTTAEHPVSAESSNISKPSQIRPDTTVVEIQTTAAEHSVSADITSPTTSSQPTAATSPEGKIEAPEKSESGVEDPYIFEPCHPEVGFNARIDCAKVLRRVKI